MSKFIVLVSLFVASMINQTFSQTVPPIENGVSHELAIWRAKHYSDVRYKLNLTLEKMSPILKGEIEINVKLTMENGELKTNYPLILDWRKIKGKEDAYSIKDVELNGKVAEFEEINEHLVIKNAVQGENIVKLNFTSPISTSGSAITRYVDKEDGSEYIYSLFVPSDASTAFPVFDQPDLKARFQLSVFTPLSWKVVSNTEIDSQFDIGEGGIRGSERAKEAVFSLTNFKETKPISTYVFAFAAGEFEEFLEGFNDTSVKVMFGKPQNKDVSELFDKDKMDKINKIYVRKSQAEKFKQHSAEVFRLNRECIKYLEGYFDYKFPFPKYDLVLIPEFPFGGMEHAGATFLRESSIIFPSEPTKNDIISRANLIFHEAAHQWFGDTVTMKWFDDLWLKEGFAEFMAYKTLEKVMPEANAWKAFYERNKQLAYLTDSTKGTTPIYQEIANLSSAKSAYGNIVYRKAPSFLRQAEFYLGEKEFQLAVKSFLKKNEFKNAEWTDLVKEFETATKEDLKDWASKWVTKRSLSTIRVSHNLLNTPTIGKFDFRFTVNQKDIGGGTAIPWYFEQKDVSGENTNWLQNIKVLRVFGDGEREEATAKLGTTLYSLGLVESLKSENTNPVPTRSLTNEEREVIKKKVEKSIADWKAKNPLYVFPNYQDYGYGIFLLDEKSRNYILANVQNEKDDFLRSMMYGSLWDSVREAELNPKDFVELAIKNVGTEKDEMIVSAILSRVNTAFACYLDDKTRNELSAKMESVLINKMQTAETQSQKITFYRAFLNVANSENARNLLKDFLKPKAKNQSPFALKTKDKFDILTKLLILGDKDAENLLAELVKTETSDDAKRYAYAARAGIATAENKAKYFNDFVANKDISESWIESAFIAFNSTKHSDLTIQYLEKALAELPNLKRNRKIFFVNGWLAAFIGGQKSVEALAIVNKFLADNPNLDKDLRLKILENVDVIERAVKIRGKFGK
jgi:aminopeptidase N